MENNFETIRSKVLLCDDEKLFSGIISAILVEYEVQVASSGQEALELLPIFQPDLILLDVQMGDIDGYEVCRRIRADPKFRFVKVVFVSGNVSLSDRLSGYKAGGDDYITKPFDSQEFLAKIRVLTRLKAVQEVDQIKQNFMALISHETRTPLTIIGGMTELLIEDRGRLSEEQKKDFLQRINSATRRLSRLSEKTLLACQLNDKTLPALPRDRQFAVEDLVEDSLEGLTDLLAECGVAVESQLESAKFQGSMTYLAKALTFVLENAIRFSPKDTVVIVSGKLDGAAYDLSIIDKGPGIPAERLGQIFDLFAISDVAHHSAGLGISLAVSRRIADLYRGTLTATSGKGGGSAFVFRLPVA